MTDVRSERWPDRQRRRRRTVGSPRAAAVTTCTRFANVAKEDLVLIDALRMRGIEATHAAWDDPEVDWPAFDLAVVRSTWDYPERLDDFLDWARRLRRVLNPLEVLQWNTDKRYLGDLAAAGLAVIPTRFVRPGDDFETPKTPFVVKPAVSNGALDTAWYRAGDAPEARAHVRRLQSSGRIVLIQPYLANIEEEGEVALVFLGGCYSHAIRRAGSLKRPGLAPDGAVPPAEVRAYEPTRAERALAAEVMACVPCGPSGLLFGRIDLVSGPGGKPMVLEAELTEPALFLDFSEGGIGRFADAIAAALGGG
jgi:glutathione synthase/RimK-type ligase-like ATP-grasp enzyme